MKRDFRATLKIPRNLHRKLKKHAFARCIFLNLMASQWLERVLQEEERTTKP